MQGPTGSSGVQRVPNRGQRSGESLPVMTWPQRLAVVGGSAESQRTEKRFSAS